jgi:hypothetical protein
MFLFVELYSETDSIALFGRDKQSRNSDAPEKLPIHKGETISARSRCEV